MSKIIDTFINDILEQSKNQNQQQFPTNNLISSYIVGKSIGFGRLGKIKLAKHIHTDQLVALKIIQKNLIFEQNLQEKLYREIEIMKLLHHPYIIQLYELLETPQQFIIVQEYARYGDLYDYILTQGKLLEQEAAQKFWQIINAVDYLHVQNICHRDLKVENILIDHRKNLKLNDFQLATYQKNHNDLLKTFCGSFEYSAPEILMGKKYNGYQADIWSLGIILFVLLCGYLPFEGSISEIIEQIQSNNIRRPIHVSDDAQDLLKKILISDPSLRLKLYQIKKHVWFRKIKISQFIPQQIILDRHQLPIDKYLISQTNKINQNPQQTKEQVEKNRHTPYSTGYYLLLQKQILLQGKSTADMLSESFKVKAKQRGKITLSIHLKLVNQSLQMHMDNRKENNNSSQEENGAKRRRSVRKPPIPIFSRPTPKMSLQQPSFEKIEKLITEIDQKPVKEKSFFLQELDNQKKQRFATEFQKVDEEPQKSEKTEQIQELESEKESESDTNKKQQQKSLPKIRKVRRVVKPKVQQEQVSPNPVKPKMTRYYLKQPSGGNKLFQTFMRTSPIEKFIFQNQKKQKIAKVYNNLNETKKMFKAQQQIDENNLNRDLYKTVSIDKNNDTFYDSSINKSSRYSPQSSPQSEGLKFQKKKRRNDGRKKKKQQSFNLEVEKEKMEMNQRQDSYNIERKKTSLNQNQQQIIEQIEVIQEDEKDNQRDNKNELEKEQGQEEKQKEKIEEKKEKQEEKQEEKTDQEKTEKNIEEKLKDDKNEQ